MILNFGMFSNSYIVLILLWRCALLIAARRHLNLIYSGEKALSYYCAGQIKKRFQTLLSITVKFREVSFGFPENLEDSIKRFLKTTTFEPHPI